MFTILIAVALLAAISGLLYASREMPEPVVIDEDIAVYREVDPSTPLSPGVRAYRGPSQEIEDAEYRELDPVYAAQKAA